jgi:hypothetical protein
MLPSRSRTKWVKPKLGRVPPWVATISVSALASYFMRLSLRSVGECREADSEQVREPKEESVHSRGHRDPLPAFECHGYYLHRDCVVAAHRIVEA